MVTQAYVQSPELVDVDALKRTLRMSRGKMRPIDDRFETALKMTADALHSEEHETDLDKLKTWIKKLENTTNYNRNLKEVVPILASKEKCVFEMPVGEESLNGYGTLHGAATMCLLDVLTAWSVALSTSNKNVVSVDMSCSYLLPVAINDVVEIHVSVLRVGRTTAFAEAEFRRKSDGKLAAKGRQTLAIIEKRSQPPVTTQ